MVLSLSWTIWFSKLFGFRLKREIRGFVIKIYFMRTISKMLYKFLSNNFDDELGTETSEKGQNLAKFGVHVINYH